MEGRDSGEVDGRIRRQEGKGRWRETAERNAMLLFSCCAKEAKKGRNEDKEKRREDFLIEKGKKREIMSLRWKGAAHIDK